MRKLCLGVSTFCVILFPPALGFAYECETFGGLKFNSTQALNEKFTLALADCSAETKAAVGSEQLRLYDTDEATRIISAGRYQAASPVALKPPANVNYAGQIAAVGRDFDIDPGFLAAVMHVESRGNAKAVSPKGARGLMQVMPATASRMGVKDPIVALDDPVINLRTGAAYLKTLQKRFGNDLDLVLAAYNAGEGAVMKYGRKVPPYRETQGYVTSVMDRYRGLRAAGGW
jgi:soluble lytic murein transglycosylase-like protein